MKKTNLKQSIKDTISKYSNNYIEIRIEETQTNTLRYTGKKLDEIHKNNSIGGCIRALSKHGWGFSSFNNLDNLQSKTAEAINMAKTIKGKSIVYLPNEKFSDIVKLNVKKDPRNISIVQKKTLLDEYIDCIWEHTAITSSNLRYTDMHKYKIFANSEGSYIEQERIDVTLGASVIAKKDEDVQQATISIGSLGDFSIVENLHSEMKGLCNKAISFLTAPKIKPGEYSVILDPILAGVFVHEAFGHLSEADHVYENEQLKEIMQLGKQFGPNDLNIVDGASIPDLRGSYKYDDEGVLSTKTYLMQNGILTGRLHSRETAGNMNENLTGNARAINTNFPPIVRMTNTYIEPSKYTFEELLNGIDEGIYAKNWYGGMTSMEQFTFSAGEAYMIKNGKIDNLIRPVMLSGNLFSTLKNISGIGNDIDMNQGGGCGKGGQIPLPVSNGSPHILIDKCLISG